MLCGHNMGLISYYMLAKVMGHVPQDFAMFEPNNNCVLTIQLHFDFFRLIQLFQKPVLSSIFHPGTLRFHPGPGRPGCSYAITQNARDKLLTEKRNC